MLKAICILTLLVTIGFMGYLTYNAIQTNRRNKAKSETHSRIFMAQIEKELREKEANGTMNNVQKTAPKYPLIITPEEPKALNYDEYTDDVDLSAANGKTLKDFFAP